MTSLKIIERVTKNNADESSDWIDRSSPAGHVGDRIGRKVSLLISIVAMALPTVLIGCLPSYQVRACALARRGVDPILLVKGGTRACVRLGSKAVMEFGGWPLRCASHPDGWRDVCTPPKGHL